MTKKSQAIILGIVCLLLTISICVQIKTVDTNGTTTSANKEINNLKTQVLKMKEKYEDTYNKLEVVQNEIETAREKVTSSNNQLKSIEEKIKKYNNILGTSEVTGPGVKITITDATVNNSLMALFNPEDLIVHNTDILEIVNELKNAGAEAISVNGQRISANTAISCDGNVIVINGEKISSPFEINAIGFGAYMATLNRPGGYLRYELEERNNIKVTFKEEEKIEIPKYIGGTNFKYAKTVNK
jgi:uncharacterized protein YlxW (UPF0749 family)